VLPGQYITSQEQVGAPPVCNTPNTAPVTAADRAFMAGVIEVNTEFAVAYTELEAENPSNVRGINFNPETTFNDRDLPSFAGVPTRNPSFRNRIIGDVRLADTNAAASAKMGNKISLRADEGNPFRVGTIRRTIGDDDAALGMADRHTQHALESTQIKPGNNGVRVPQPSTRRTCRLQPDPDAPQFYAGRPRGVLPLSGRRQRNRGREEPGPAGQAGLRHHHSTLHRASWRCHVPARVVRRTFPPARGRVRRLGFDLLRRDEAR
jgi:hypothetical protein